MKQFYKECKTVKGINGYLKTIGLEDYGIDREWFEKSGVSISYFDIDTWINAEKTKGVSITLYKDSQNYEVFVIKYESKDLGV